MVIREVTSPGVVALLKEFADTANRGALFPKGFRLRRGCSSRSSIAVCCAVGAVTVLSSALAERLLASACVEEGSWAACAEGRAASRMSRCAGGSGSGGGTRRRDCIGALFAANRASPGAHGGRGVCGRLSDLSFPCVWRLCSLTCAVAGPKSPRTPECLLRARSDVQRTSDAA